MGMFFFFTVPFCANAQLSFGGKQIMYWGSDICSDSSTNVHFIVNADMLVTLYDSPATDAKGDSDVEFGISQTGTYEPVPTECIMDADVPIVLWVTDGIYETVSTSLAMKDKFFAGAVDPFIKKINTKA